VLVELVKKFLPVDQIVQLRAQVEMILIYYALVVPSVLPLTLVLKLLVSKLSVCLLTLQLIIIVVYIHLLQ
jgi:hypothetical protein